MTKIVNLDHLHTPVSCMSYKDGAEAEVENGAYVTVGALIEGEKEIFKCEEAKDGDSLVGIVCTPEFEYDETGYHGIDTFKNEAGVPVRVAYFAPGKIHSISIDEDESVTVGSTITVGNYVLTCIDIYTKGRHKYAAYREDLASQAATE